MLIKLFWLVIIAISKFIIIDALNDTKQINKLNICEEYNVCNIIHNRYWLPNKIEKICICSNNNLCSATYSTSDDYYININHRTQIKFCQPINDKIPTCQQNEIGLTEIHHQIQIGAIKKTINFNININCVCNITTNYWKYFSYIEKYFDDNKKINIMTNYKCIPLKKCEPNKFCGFVRSDYGFLYQRGSCPKNYNCIYDTDSYLFENVKEVFYNHTAYKAYCLPDLHNVW